MESQHMTIRDNKTRQEEALAVQFRPQHSPQFHPHIPFYQASNPQRRRGFARPVGLFYSTSSNQFRSNFPGTSLLAMHNFPLNIQPPSTYLHSFLAHASTNTGQPRTSRPHLITPYLGQNFNTFFFAFLSPATVVVTKDTSLATATTTAMQVSTTRKSNIMTTTFLFTHKENTI